MIEEINLVDKFTKELANRTIQAYNEMAKSDEYKNLDVKNIDCAVIMDKLATYILQQIYRNSNVEEYIIPTCRVIDYYDFIFNRTESVLDLITLNYTQYCAIADIAYGILDDAIKTDTYDFSHVIRASSILAAGYVEDMYIAKNEYRDNKDINIFEYRTNLIKKLDKIRYNEIMDVIIDYLNEHGGEEIAESVKHCESLKAMMNIYFA